MAEHDTSNEAFILPDDMPLREEDDIVATEQPTKQSERTSKRASKIEEIMSKLPVLEDLGILRDDTVGEKKRKRKKVTEKPKKESVEDQAKKEESYPRDINFLQATLKLPIEEHEVHNTT